MRRTPLKRVKLASKPRKPIKRGKYRFKKNESDLKREWLVPMVPLRYVGLRGIYWYWLSRDVRKSEWEKYNGECITCLVPLATWEEGQCGHILASAFCGEYLRLNRINLTLQHAKCNNPRFSPHAGVANAININKRHGDGYIESLYSLRKKECKSPTQDEYRALIRALPSYQEALSTASTLHAQKETDIILPRT